MKTRYIATFLYVMVFSFGMGFGTWKNHTWDFSVWGYNSSRIVSYWWIIMGFVVTLVCGLMWLYKQVMKDYNKKKQADFILND